MADHPTTVVVDWDDTVVGYHKYGTEGDWLSGAADGLRELLRDGYAVTVASCRVTWQDGLETIVQELFSNGFKPLLVLSEADSAMLGVHPLLRSELLAACPTVRVSPPAGELGVWIGLGKPIGSFYLDDRGGEFVNDWEGALELIGERAPVRK